MYAASVLDHVFGTQARSEADLHVSTTIPARFLQHVCRQTLEKIAVTLAQHGPTGTAKR